MSARVRSRSPAVDDSRWDGSVTSSRPGGVVWGPPRVREGWPGCGAFWWAVWLRRVASPRQRPQPSQTAVAGVGERQGSVPRYQGRRARPGWPDRPARRRGRVEHQDQRGAPGDRVGRYPVGARWIRCRSSWKSGSSTHTVDRSRWGRVAAADAAAEWSAPARTAAQLRSPATDRPARRIGGSRRCSSAPNPGRWPRW